MYSIFLFFVRHSILSIFFTFFLFSAGLEHHVVNLSVDQIINLTIYFLLVVVKHKKFDPLFHSYFVTINIETVMASKQQFLFFQIVLKTIKIRYDKAVPRNRLLVIR